MCSAVPVQLVSGEWASGPPPGQDKDFKTGSAKVNRHEASEKRKSPDKEPLLIVYAEGGGGQLARCETSASTLSFYSHLFSFVPNFLFPF